MRPAVSVFAQRLAVAIALLVAAASFGSCATAGRRPSLYANEDIPSLVAANPTYRSLLMSGRVRLEKRFDGKVETVSKLSVAMREPSSFRVSFNDSLGSAWFLAVSDGERTAVSAPLLDVYTETGNSGVGGGIIKFWGIGMAPSDFFLFLHPGLDERWILDGGGVMEKGYLVVRYPGVRYAIKFDDRKRVISATIDRDGVETLEVAYRYDNGGTDGLYAVIFKGFLEFDFGMVASGKEISDAVFIVPFCHACGSRHPPARE